ncbi:cell division septum initiation protein DivIVA [Methanococcus voltae]|uniref:AAA family ATPase n=1 Tax=Methanococcus voltae TaxID=2188 RepID=UPI001AE394A9|nr:AAA family ATPase [Methanococcus voltae]MBP2143826.1 cell division septum initiation protein DivIVA [Methanococcus voltae]
MSKFKIKSFDISKFSNDAYLGVKKEDTYLHSLLIRGANKTGKSTTVEALNYAIYGPECVNSKYPITNNSRTDIELENSDYNLKIYRSGNKKHKLIIKNKNTNETLPEITNHDEIQKNLIKIFNMEYNKLKELKYKTIYQNENNNLRKKGINELKNAISYYGGYYKENLELIEDEQLLNQIKKEIEKLDNSNNQIKKEIEKLDRNIKYNEQDQQNISQFIQYYESGELEKYFTTKKKNKEAENELKKLGQVVKEITRLQEEKRGMERSMDEINLYYENKIMDILKDILSSLNCPVCGGEIEEKSLKYRVEHKQCPFCGKKHDSIELYEKIKQKISLSKEQHPETIAKIDKLNKIISAKKDLRNNITKKNKKNPFYGLKNYTIRIVEKYDSIDSDEIKNEYSECKIKYKSYTESNQEYKDNIKKLDSDVEKNNNNIETLKNSKQTVSKHKTDLKTKLKQDIESYFLERLNYYYSYLFGSKADLIISSENNYIFSKPLAGNSNKYVNIFDSSIGQCQKKCLDMAIVLALSDMDLKNNISNLCYILMEEPSEGIYDDKDSEGNDIEHKQNLFELLNNKIKEGIQLIILSAEESYPDNLEIPEKNVLKLKHNYQDTLHGVENNG